MEAQKKLDWAAANEAFKCRIIGFDSDRGVFKVQFRQEEVLIAIRDIPQEWINSIEPESDHIGDALERLFREIDLAMNPFCW